MINDAFWMGKKVFITGHTGFKGAWLTLWLVKLGAKVTGYSLEPPTTPSLFDLCQLEQDIHSIKGDIRDLVRLSSVLEKDDPDIIIHMAAQPLVRESYSHPVETYEINVIGTLNLYEAIRKLTASRETKKRIIINVTTDKCYENKEWHWGYREHEPMGGHDPYSNSKACSELITSSYRNSYFHPSKVEEHGVLLASARAGNVIGGGDWAADRLVPDCIKSLLKNQTIIVRNPYSIRPWQHVLEPLNGYLVLAQTLYEKGGEYAEGWNFGPNDDDARTVEWIVNRICKMWGEQAEYTVFLDQNAVHEAKYLKLDCSKAKARLGWYPTWDIEKALSSIVNWVDSYKNNENIKALCLRQIQEFTSAEKVR